MGGGEIVDVADYENARCLGGLIAKEGWILLNGGRASGIMEASARGGKGKRWVNHRYFTRYKRRVGFRIYRYSCFDRSRSCPELYQCFNQ